MDYQYYDEGGTSVVKKDAPSITDTQIENLLHEFAPNSSEEIPEPASAPVDVPETHAVYSDTEQHSGMNADANASEQSSEMIQDANASEQSSGTNPDANVSEQSSETNPDTNASEQSSEITQNTQIDQTNKKVQPGIEFSRPTFRILVLLIMILVSAWLLPSANVRVTEQNSSSAKDRDSFFQMSAQHLLSDSLNEVHYIRRKYILEMSETLTPAPDETKFEQKYDIERKNFDGTPIYYYNDDSIEVKCWREKIDENIFNFSEIWITDPSQFRRTLVDNVINKKHLDHPHHIFQKTNGVVGMTADYCAFRNYGIVVQYGNLIRDNYSNVLDIAVFDKNGNLSAYEDNKEFFDTAIYTKGEVVHTFAFGPVLVDNYAVNESGKLTNRYYPGELNDTYPRAAICQFDYNLHYLLCTLDYHGLSAKEFAEVLQSKGVRFAYNLDGGQTATLMFNKKIINKVAYGGTRPVSDILYFATAIPEDARS